MGGGARGGGGKRGGKGGGAGDGVLYEDWTCSLCNFPNFGWRRRCKSCEASPPGGARIIKGRGKGTGGGQGAGGGVGGIADRQLQLAEQARRDQQRAIDKVRAESKKEVEKLRKELIEARRGAAAAAAGGAAVVDMSGDDDDDEAGDSEADKEQQLAAEIRALEASLVGLPEAIPFRATTQKRVEEAKAELQALRERRGGPGARVLGAANKHQKDLRAAKNKLLKRTKAQERAEAQVEELEEQLARTRDLLRDRNVELKKIKEEVQEAHDELQRLAGTGAGDGDALGKGAGDHSTQGGQAQTAHVFEQLASMLPSGMQQQLVGLREAALQHQVEQQRLREQQAQAQQRQQQQQQQQQQAAADAATATAATPAAAETPQRPEELQKGMEEDDMEDIDESTVELVGALQKVLEAEEANAPSAAAASDGISGSNSRRATLVDHLKKRGSASARIQGVIRDFKKKHKGKLELKGPSGQDAKDDGKPAAPQA